MAQLTFEFFHMFLFVERPNGLTVFAPRKQHTASMAVEGALYDVANHSVVLMRNGQRIDEALTPASGQWLVSMADLVQPGSAPYPTDVLDQGWTTRFELGGAGGQLIESEPRLEAAYAQYRDVAWEFPVNGGTYAHALTNLVTVTIPLTAGATYELRITNLASGAVVTVPIPSAGAFVKIENMDDDKDNRMAAYTGSLEEFQFLYDLMRQPNGQPATGGIPRDPNSAANLATARAMQSAATAITAKTIEKKWGAMLAQAQVSATAVADAFAAMSVCIEPACPGARSSGPAR